MSLLSGQEKEQWDGASGMATLMQPAESSEWVALSPFHLGKLRCREVKAPVRS